MTSTTPHSARLATLGITLPHVAAPVAAYVPATIIGNQAACSGQLPFVDGKLTVTGLVGSDVDVATAAEQARIAALNGLAAIDSVAGIDNITRIVKVTGFVASAPGFADQAKVINGASELLQDIFGDAGIHIRSAVGVAALPLTAPVEVEIVAEISDRR